MLIACAGLHTGHGAMESCQKEAFQECLKDFSFVVFMNVVGWKDYICTMIVLSILTLCKNSFYFEVQEKMGLKGISPCISPDLLKLLSEMGHGDTIGKEA